MNTFVKKLVSGIAALTMCLSVAPMGASADTTDIEAIQEEFNEVESSNPDYMEFTYYDLEDGTTSSVLVDNNMEGLQEYFDAQEQFDEFISVCSITSGNSSGLSIMTETDNKIGWLTVNDGAISGTGFLIANDLVLTAAHCLMSGDTGELRVDLSTVGFSAGVYEGAALSSAKSIADGVFIPSKFFENGESNYKYDYAVVKLNKEIGKAPSIGYYEIGIPTSGVVGHSVTTKGYGYDATLNPNYLYPMYSTGVVTSITAGENEDRVSTTCTTSSGMSGGPVIDNTNDTVIAIHSSHDSNYSYGTKIIGSIYRFTIVDFDTAVGMPLT
ncbi:MAG: serine protease [Ruminococcus sp.]|nr:serine protease [Ruminococcus sp.]